MIRMNLYSSASVVHRTYIVWIERRVAMTPMILMMMLMIIIIILTTTAATKCKPDRVRCRETLKTE